MGSGPEQALEKLFALAAVTHQYMEQGMAARGLTRARASVLWNLHLRGPMTQRALAEAIEVTPRNVTGLVDALEADGFVARGPHPGDRRATLVALTDSGAETMGGLRGEYDQGAVRLFDGLTASELAGFVTTADHLIERLAQENC
ncbi:MarR family winged helix-turn-helix transcriptional regulator [Lipingzhangella halophila]|uniref:MarR family winged helix-turn-helix transcriptional regulator n=1 Tax=Lipingzhangella halophila TaxID=1783352 RepID=UPI001C881698|nr:MarR family transcriptional regulator [Lipingzhangella halophila]